MSTLTNITAALPVAMKARDTFATSVLRQAIGAIRAEEKAGPVAVELTEPQVQAVLAREVKKRRDTATVYTEAGAPDRAAREAREADFIEAYLPAALSDEQLDQLVSQAVALTGATTVKDMGSVMKAATTAASGLGRVDGKLLSAKVRAALS